MKELYPSEISVLEAVGRGEVTSIRGFNNHITVQGPAKKEKLKMLLRRKLVERAEADGSMYATYVYKLTDAGLAMLEMYKEKEKQEIPACPSL